MISCMWKVFPFPLSFQQQHDGFFSTLGPILRSKFDWEIEVPIQHQNSIFILKLIFDGQVLWHIQNPAKDLRWSFTRK